MTKNEILSIASKLKNDDSYTWLQKRIIDCIFYGGVHVSAHVVDGYRGMSTTFVSREAIEQLKKDGFTIKENPSDDVVEITWN